MSKSSDTTKQGSAEIGLQDYPELHLSNQLCFLVYKLQHLINGVYRPLLDEVGLTYPQYLVMLVLWEKKQQSVGEICAALGLDSGTISPLLKRLETLGYIVRNRNPKDERSVSIELTQEGIQMQEAARIVPEGLASCILRSEEDYHQFRENLLEIIERLEAPGCQDKA